MMYAITPHFQTSRHKINTHSKTQQYPTSPTKQSTLKSTTLMVHRLCKLPCNNKPSAPLPSQHLFLYPT